MQGVWDPAHSTRVGIPSDCRHFTRMYHIRNSAPLSFYPDVSHSKFCSAAIPPGCLTFEILLRRHSTRMSHIHNSGRVTFNILRIFCIRRLTPDGRGVRFNFSGYTYPNPLIAFTRRVSQPFCTVLIVFTRRISQPFFAQCRGVLLKLPGMCDRHL